MRKIANSAHCSIGTFYNYYKSIDDLIIHFNGTTLDILSISIFDGITPTCNPKEIINKICRNYIDFAENHYAEWLLLLEHPIGIEIPIWYRDKSEQLFKKVANFFHPIFRGKKKDTDKAVKILWGSLHGICSLTLKNRLRFKQRQNLLELCQDLFHHYILGFRIGLEK